MSKELMDKANVALASASILLDAGDSDGAVSRAYYAMYDAARAVIDWAGLTPPREDFKSHSGLISYFGLHFAKTGKLPIELGRSLNRINELRSIADYLAEPVPHDKAAEAIQEARKFVTSIQSFIQQPKKLKPPVP